jgi:hypothetical protein
MDAERNKETIRRATEAWNARDRTAFLECHAAKGVSHPTSGEAPLQGCDTSSWGNIAS